MYFACFRVHLRYGLTPWGGDPESIRIFQLQKKVIRIIGKAGQHASFIQWMNTCPMCRHTEREFYGKVWYWQPNY
jgi:hypothetical protein